MRIIRLAWVGIPTDSYQQMRQFLVDGLGLREEFDQHTTVEVALDGGDRLQLFGPGSDYFSFYREQDARLVPLFEVDDLDTAQAQVQRAGAVLVRVDESDDLWRWCHVRAPDGNLYAFAERVRPQHLVTRPRPH
jgi:catechol 2,3-dioxygenase-like lactoylglutathione lyase family enzyme